MHEVDHSWNKQKILAGTLLALSVVVSFCPALQNGFVYDDHFQLVGNPFVKEVRYIPVLFTSDVWHFSSSTRSNNYRPFHMLTYLLIYRSFGLNPFFFHLANILFYVATVLLFWLCLLYYADSIAAFTASLLFALHPVHVELVAWIGGIPDLLCGMFLLLAFLLYLRGSIFLSLIPFAAALLSKEPALVFPGILMIDHLLFARYPKRKFVHWLISASVILLIYSVIRTLALGTFLRSHSIALGAFNQLLTAASFAGFYLRKLLLPVQLNAYYDFSLPLAWSTAAIGIAILVLSIAGLFVMRRNKAFLCGAAWFAVLLFPALTLTGVSPVLFAERYVYLPSIGFFLAIASLPLKRPVWVALFCLAVAAGIGSFHRSAVWRDDLTLWSDTLKKSPRSHIVNFNLATAYVQQSDWRTAARFYLQTIALRPDYAEAYFNLAVCRFNLGDKVGAARNLKLFLRYAKAEDPNRQEAISKLKQLGQTSVFGSGPVNSTDSGTTGSVPSTVRRDGGSKQP